MEAYEQRTDGVNYDPQLPFTSTRESDDAGSSISSAPMHFSVSAELAGEALDLIGPMAVCGSGCRKTRLTRNAEASDATADVAIVRFAKYGTTHLPDGSLMTWLIVMEDGDTLSGPMRVPAAEPSSNRLADYPGELQLGGRMVITAQIGENPPFRLRSRTEPLLAGLVPGWPPYGMRLDLDNGPIDYFLEEALEDESAEPLIRVTANRVLLGTAPHPILSRAPEITKTSRSDTGAIQLTWTATAEERETEPPITAYHVYRNLEPDNLASWELVAALPSTQTSWEDSETTTSQSPTYLLVHAAECPFGYKLEGALGTPAATT